MSHHTSSQSPEELEREIRSDPVKWAYWKLKDPKGRSWRARWYQAKILRDITQKGLKRIAVRMGRRVGKTDCMCVFALWYAFHHKNSRILFAAPYENQVRLIFMRLNEMIDSCEELQVSIKTRTKNPFVIQFNNGAAILGFTVGATSGHSGASVRGQRADWILLDEIDYMDRDGIDAVTAIALEDPKRIGIWCSSTPTGKRDFFYEICTNPETGYTAYHYPSMVNPDWDEKMEAELRATMTEQGYIHEVLAEFGEETVGVFNKEAIERAKNQLLYSYRKLNAYEIEVYKKEGYDVDDIIYLGPYTKSNPAPPAIRVMGVDWDKYGDNTQIVITEFDEFLKKFKVAYRAEISRGEFTFDNAVNKIIELNEIFDPRLIYIDRGFGEYQVERIRKYGHEHPETGLDKKVKGIHFASKIDVRDPVTGEIDRKDIKPFMVNQTSILLERGQLLLSPFDDLIWKQMMNYQVVRVTQSGRPVYTSENEHALDALMLTILAFTIEMPELTKIMEQMRVAKAAKMVKKEKNDVTLYNRAYGSSREVFQEKKREIEPRDNPRWHWRKVPLGYSKKRDVFWTRGKMGVFTRSKF